MRTLRIKSIIHYAVPLPVLLDEMKRAKLFNSDYVYSFKA